MLTFAPFFTPCFRPEPRPLAEGLGGGGGFLLGKVTLKYSNRAVPITVFHEVTYAHVYIYYNEEQICEDKT